MKPMHTPEPWFCDGDAIYNNVHCAGDPIAHVLTMPFDDAGNACDARRIVACVNACAGLDTEKLEAQNAEGNPLWQFVQEVIAQRDHWKANHENQVRRTRILIERTDMPLERVAAYNRMVELEQQRDQLLAALEALMPVANDWCNYRGNPQSLDAMIVAARAAIAAVKKGGAA